MFEKPSIFKVPTIISNSYNNAACGTYSPTCSSSYSNRCADSYKEVNNGSVSTPTDIIGDAVGIAITTVGSIATVTTLT